jgi:hypothetical protein
MKCVQIEWREQGWMSKVKMSDMATIKYHMN